MEENRKKALVAALGQIEKQFGKGSVMRLGDASASYDVEVVSTGSLGLDIALGVGGLPRGRVIEIYGPESSGKTTLDAAGRSPRRRGAAARRPSSTPSTRSTRPTPRSSASNVNDLLVSQPDTGEQALEITDMLVRSGAVDVVVVDSVAALTPKAEIEGEMGDTHMGLQARLMSQALRKLTGNIKRSNTIVIFINQIRMKIGVMFGNPETTTGGNALKFYASVRLDIRRIGAIKKGEEVVGNQTRVKVVKNKVAPPFREAEFEIMYGVGISREGEIIDMGVAQNLIEKSGSWYAYNGERIGQGKENVRAYLHSIPRRPARSKPRCAPSCWCPRRARPPRVRRRRPEPGAAAEADPRAVQTAAYALLAGRDFSRHELTRTPAAQGLPSRLRRGRGGCARRGGLPQGGPLRRAVRDPRVPAVARARCGCAWGCKAPWRRRRDHRAGARRRRHRLGAGGPGSPPPQVRRRAAGGLPRTCKTGALPPISRVFFGPDPGRPRSRRRRRRTHGPCTTHEPLPGS